MPRRVKRNQEESRGCNRIQEDLRRIEILRGLKRSQGELSRVMISHDESKGVKKSQEKSRRVKNDSRGVKMS